MRASAGWWRRVRRWRQVGCWRACGAGGGATETAPAATKPTGTVAFWHNWTTRGPLLRGYFDQFEKENPGVKIEDTDVSTMGGRAKVPTAILSGTAPDVLHLFVDMIPQLAPSKALKGLGPYASRDKVNLKDFYDAEIQARSIDGQLIAMPVVVAANAHFVYWNKERFRRAGLDPEAGPRTWAQALEMAQKLNVRGPTAAGPGPGRAARGGRVLQPVHAAALPQRGQALLGRPQEGRLRRPGGR